MKSREDFKFNRLKMYRGRDYEINDKIKIRTPEVGEIIDVGDDEFYSNLTVFTGNPTTYRLILWDMGIDWNKITDYELFQMIYKGMKSDICKMIFGESFDLGNFELYKKQMSEDDEDYKIVLYDSENDIEIDEEIYLEISQYIRTMFNSFPKVEHAKGKYTKEAIIDEEREKQRIQKDKPKDDSVLLSLISSCVNHPGFKYTAEELDHIGIVQFMDSVQRLQVYENSIAALRGAHSGFVDTSKMKPDTFNFMREISNN